MNNKGIELKTGEYFRTVGRPLCVHDVEAIGFPYYSSVIISQLMNKGKVVRCDEKSTCKYSDRPHTFYNYSGMDRIEAKRSAEVGAMLTKEYEKKMKTIEIKHREEMARLKSQMRYRQGRKKLPNYAKEELNELRTNIKELREIVTGLTTDRTNLREDKSELTDIVLHLWKNGNGNKLGCGE